MVQTKKNCSYAKSLCKTAFAHTILDANSHTDPTSSERTIKQIFDIRLNSAEHFSMMDAATMGKDAIFCTGKNRILLRARISKACYKTFLICWDMGTDNLVYCRC